MDVNKLTDLANRLMKGGRGAGVGLGFMAAVAGTAYGLSQSMYTGITSIIETHLQSYSVFTFI